MIKAIIFDFGGPIVEWDAPMREVYKKHERHHNLEADELLKVFQAYYEASDIGGFDSLTHFIETTKPPLKLTIEELNEVFDEANESMQIRPEIIDYIVELKKEYKIGLLSNFAAGLPIFLQKIFNVYHLFDVVVSSHAVKMRKPDPRIYQHTLDELGVAAEEAVFIDDLKENVKAAEALGIRSILFKDSKQCKEELEKLLHDDND